MKTLRYFICTIPEWSPGWDLEANVIAHSASKARYRFWQEKCEVLPPYRECFGAIKVRVSGSNDPSLFFGDPEEFQRMKQHRDLPFLYQGQKVEVDGRPGIITGTTGGFNLAVMFENSFKTDSNCHPYWKVKYFGPDGAIVSEFKDSILR